MPSIGRFLEMIEAVSRRDWSAIEKIGRAAADEERSRKHYQAAHKINKALEVAISKIGIEDSIGTVSSPLTPLSGEIPSLLHEVKTDNIPNPILPQLVMSSVDELVGEWRLEDKLRTEGIHPRKTILLYGLPGCGKTLLASYIAKHLKLRLFVIRFDNLISSYLGETGTNIKKVFDFVANNRCALFIDEFDAIAKQRDDINELGELKRVVITLLQNLDMAAGKSILIAGTNHPHMLDAAIWRRFELIMELLPPKSSDRLNIFSLYLDKEIPKDIRNVLAHCSNGFTGSDIFQICNNTKRKALIKNSNNLFSYLCFSILEHLDRSPPKSIEKKPDERKISAVLALKLLDNKTFSFVDLEALSGIPRSTLHNKYKQLNRIIDNV